MSYNGLCATIPSAHLECGGYVLLCLLECCDQHFQSDPLGYVWFGLLVRKCVNSLDTFVPATTEHLDRQFYMLPSMHQPPEPAVYDNIHFKSLLLDDSPTQLWTLCL